MPAAGSTIPRLGGPFYDAPSIVTFGWVAVPRIGLRVALVDYTDCTGVTPLTRRSGARWDCTPPGVAQLVAHNPGLFTPLLQARRGDEVDYFDGVSLERYTIETEVRTSHHASTSYALDGSFPHLVMTTCAIPDGTEVWVFETGQPWGTGVAQTQRAAPAAQPDQSPSAAPTPGAVPLSQLTPQSEPTPTPTPAPLPLPLPTPTVPPA